MNELKIEYLKLEEIIPYINNPKEHPEKQIQAIMSSIHEYGYVNPIIVDKDNVIIAGHGRYEALKRLGVKEVPVIRAEHLTPEQVKAYRIADNRIAELGLWDEELLRVELEQILDEIKDLGLPTGFTDKEIEKLLQSIEEVSVEEKDNQLPEEAQALSQEGDIWELGPHRVICSDSTRRDTYEKLLGSQKVNMVMTSPPYAEQRKEEYGGIPPDEYPEWFTKIADNIWKVLEEDGSFFINIIEHAENGQKSLYFYKTLFRLLDRGWKYIDRLIWKKKNPIPGDYTNRLKPAYEDVHWIAKKDECTYYIEVVDIPDEHLDPLSVYLVNDYEEIFHVAKRVRIKFRPRAVGKKGESFRGRGKGATKNKNVGVSRDITKRKGVVRPSNVIEAPTNKETWGHPAMYSVELASFFIRLTTERGDKVLDPFAGAGTTLIACEKLGRVFYGIELQPKYCDIIVKRYVHFKGSSEDVYLIRGGERIPYKETLLWKKKE